MFVNSKTNPLARFLVSSESGTTSAATLISQQATEIAESWVIIQGDDIFRRTAENSMWRGPDAEVCSKRESKE